MATRIKIVGHPKLTHAYNVSLHVGPDRANQADDVMLVQFLLAEVLPRHPTNRAMRERLALPAVNGRYDVATSFWIFEVQYQKTDFEHGAAVDGVVSPMMGATLNYSASATWTIGILNFLFAEHFPDRFERLHLEPRLSPSLRAAITPR